MEGGVGKIKTKTENHEIGFGDLIATCYEQRNRFLSVSFAL